MALNRRHRTSRLRALALLLALAILAPGCSVKSLAVNALGKSLADGGGTYARDDDPELVAGAIPFGLKTIEGLLEASPKNPDLLFAAASGFVQYGYAFVSQEADFVEAKDFARALELRGRAKRLYARARGYGFRGLELSMPGFTLGIRSDLEGTLARATKKDVALLYWTAAAWGAQISMSKEDSELTADLDLAAALARRALVLDETFGAGSLHDFFLSYEGARPPSAGGSPAKAREHFARAIAISSGHRAGPYVSLAEVVCVGAQNKQEFQELLEKALAVDVNADPEQRLANLIAQKRARWLLSRVDDLFIE